MHNITKIAGAIAVSSLLAACGGNSGAIPASSGSASSQHHIATQSVVQKSPYTMVLSNGHTVHYFPTRGQALRTQLSLQPSSQDNLRYGGGPIQASPKVYVVFWGSIWQNTTGDPDGVKKRVKAFLFGLKGSQWTSTLTQYYGPVNTYIKNNTTLAGSFIDTQNQPPTQPTDGQIAAEALVAAAHYGDYSTNASYVVAMPHGHNPQQFGISYCAYHDDEQGSGGVIAYTNLPYMPDAGGSCGEGFVNNPGVLDGVSIVEGHEQAETETDPQPFSGWNGPLGEIGDACAWQGLQNTQFKEGLFPTQPLWSNSAGGCVQ